MRRREFITILGGLAATSPLVARAQQEKIWRIGWLTPGTITPLFDIFRQQLKELGYVESKNLVIEKREAEGQFQRLPILVQELIEFRPDVIVTGASPATAAAQSASSTIPIVMLSVNDPIGSGFVRSLARPGGNITGVANMFGDTMGKTVEILHSLVPDARKVAVLLSSNAIHPGQYGLARTASEAIGLSTVPILASTPGDLKEAFQKILGARCEALFVLADNPIRPSIVSLAAETKIPAIYQFKEYAAAGGLISYGASNSEIFKRGAHFVDRIFKGASPGDIPVEQPVHFELVINLKTAKALGLTVSPSLLARADEVIE